MVFVCKVHYMYDLYDSWVGYLNNQIFLYVFLFSVICHKLHQMNLIDQSYNVEEFEFMRSHYQRALFHLLTVAKSVTDASENDTNVLLPFPK
jgi:hypothetical protein